MNGSRPAVHPVEAPPLTEAAAAGPRFRMKDLQGKPGTPGGLILRLIQFFSAVVSVSYMASTNDIHQATAFCYLVLAVGLQSLWSLSLPVLNIHALLVRRSLRNYVAIWFFTVGDGVREILLSSLEKFDELIEMMSSITKPPKGRRVTSSCRGSSSASATTPACTNRPDSNEVFVQTISRFLQEPRTDSTTDPDGSTSTRNQQ